MNFGWIGERGVEKRDSFSSYIESEIKRNTNRIQQVLGEKKDILDEIKSKANEASEIIKKIDNIKPVICWYDINPNNILVNQESGIVGFLDPGGARNAPKEWDLAFIKMDLCKNKKEFQYFIEEYEKSKEVNKSLLEALTIIVEIDDIAFQVESDTMLPIALESNFKNILSKIFKRRNL